MHLQFDWRHRRALMSSSPLCGDHASSSTRSTFSMQSRGATRTSESSRCSSEFVDGRHCVPPVWTPGAGEVLAALQVDQLLLRALDTCILAMRLESCEHLARHLARAAATSGSVLRSFSSALCVETASAR